MAVKASTTAGKVLAVLDAVARHQPVGVSDLARSLTEDKATVQRMLVTLAEEGWIKSDGERRTKWSVTHRLRLLADIACTDSDIIAIARPILEALRDETGETVSLVLNDAARFIVADVAESDAMLRAVPRVGMEIPPPISASSLAFLAFLPKPRQAAILGRAVTASDEKMLEEVRNAGFAMHVSHRNDETVSIASAVRDKGGEPLAVVVVTAPQSRLSSLACQALGKTVHNSASEISRQTSG